VALGADVAIEDQAGKVLPGPLTEGLFLLRRVDPVEPDLVLMLVAVEDRYGVAVRDGDDASFDDP
jgi:hypothetical protein